MADKPKKQHKRGQGEGSIVKRKDGTFMAQVSLGFEIDPKTNKKKRIRKTVYGKKRAEVQEKLVKLLADHQRGINIAPDKITFGQWLDQYLENYVRPNTRIGTWETYVQNATMHIKPAIGLIPLSKLTTNALQRFYKSKLESGRLDGSGGLSLRSVKLFQSLIHATLAQAVDAKLVPYNVAEGVRLRGKKKTVGAIKPEVLTAFLQSLQERNEKFYSAYALEAVSGLRIGELMALKWTDFDFDARFLQVSRTLRKTRQGELYFNPPKTESSKRRIAIPPEVIDELKSHKVRQKADKLKLGKNYVDNDLVFCKRNGEPIDPTVFTNRHRWLVKDLKLDPFSFHALRHSVATALLVKGRSLKDVMALLGHASLAATDIYTDVLQEMKYETADVLQTLLPKRKKKTS